MIVTPEIIRTIRDLMALYPEFVPPDVLSKILDVYEAAVDWHRVRVPGMQQHDKFVSTEDALWDAVDNAASEQGKESE